MYKSYLAVIIVSVLLACICLNTKVEANPVNMTSTEAPTVSTTPVQICKQQPCGWGVYKKNRGKIEYFIKNTCVCASSVKCLHDGEDLSLGAYVYRCKGSAA